MMVAMLVLPKELTKEYHLAIRMTVKQLATQKEILMADREMVLLCSVETEDYNK